jgi:nucleotide-binding universal stress UspA family protein
MTEIIVGIDGAEQARDAAAFARSLASGTGATLRLAHAYPYEPLSRTAEAGWREHLREDGERLLADAKAELALPDAPTAVMADPSPARALHRLAEDTEAALIVIGSSHHGPIGRALPGRTGDRLLHGAPCAVAIVPRGWRRPFDATRVIGVGYDETPESEAAVAGAVALARRVQATLRIVRVFDVGRFAGAGTPAAAQYWSLMSEQERESRRRLDRLVAGLPSDVAVEGVFLTGGAAHELAEQTGSLELLVLGSRGYGPLAAVLLGGVSHAVVRHAACPVAVQPRGARRGIDQLLRPHAATTTAAEDAR